MTTALTVFLVSLGLFMVLSLVIGAETKRGQRFFLSSVRLKIDRGIERFFSWAGRTWEHFVKYLLQLGWYYSLHSLLRTLLQIVVAAYEYLEAKFERNRLRANHLKRRRKEGVDNHLSEVAAHKAEVALSPEEEVALKERKLEEND